MKVYVAARTEDRQQAEEVQRQLEAAGVEVVSRWMGVQSAAPVHDYDADPEETLRRIDMDLGDVTDGDVLVLWKPKEIHRDSTGGHHVENGWALALGKLVVLIGTRENIFHWHPFVREVDTVEAAVQTITALEEKDLPFSKHAADSYQRLTRRTAIYLDSRQKTSRAALYCAIGLGGESGEIVDKVLAHVRAESDRILARNDLTAEEAKAVENLTVVIGALHSFAYAAKRLEELKRPIRNGSMPLPVMTPFPEEVLPELALEVGDVSWYCARIADEMGFAFSGILEKNVEKLKGRKDRGTLHGTGDNR